MVKIKKKAEERTPGFTVDPIFVPRSILEEFPLAQKQDKGLRFLEKPKPTREHSEISEFFVELRLYR